MPLAHGASSDHGADSAAPASHSRVTPERRFCAASSEQAVRPEVRMVPHREFTMRASNRSSPQRLTSQLATPGHTAAHANRVNSQSCLISRSYASFPSAIHRLFRSSLDVCECQMVDGHPQVNGVPAPFIGAQTATKSPAVAHYQAYPRVSVRGHMRAATRDSASVRHRRDHSRCHKCGWNESYAGGTNRLTGAWTNSGRANLFLDFGPEHANSA
jgi:hypothetical protein